MAGENLTIDLEEIDFKRALLLEETSLTPSEVNEEEAFRAIEKMGIGNWVSSIKLEAQRTFGKYLEIQLPEGIMTSDLFETAQALKRNVEGLVDLSMNLDAIICR